MEAISPVTTTPQESTPMKENIKEVNDDCKEQFAAGNLQTIDQSLEPTLSVASKTTDLCIFISGIQVDWLPSQSLKICVEVGSFMAFTKGI